MRKPNDGGPAFPLVTRWTGDGYPYEYTNGMSLRDWFAGMALAGLSTATDEDGQWQSDPAGLARESYAIADAMLQQRDRQP